MNEHGNVRVGRGTLVMAVALAALCVQQASCLQAPELEEANAGLCPAVDADAVAEIRACGPPSPCGVCPAGQS